MLGEHRRGGDHRTCPRLEELDHGLMALLAAIEDRDQNAGIEQQFTCHA
jgi:hypothetical protein